MARDAVSVIVHQRDNLLRELARLEGRRVGLEIGMQCLREQAEREDREAEGMRRELAKIGVSVDRCPALAEAGEGR